MTDAILFHLIDHMNDITDRLSASFAQLTQVTGPVVATIAEFNKVLNTPEFARMPAMVKKRARGFNRYTRRYRRIGQNRK